MPPRSFGRGSSQQQLKRVYHHERLPEMTSGVQRALVGHSVSPTPSGMAAALVAATEHPQTKHVKNMLQTFVIENPTGANKG